jgi:hypothetical protein
MKRREALGLLVLPALGAQTWKPEVLNEHQDRTVDVLSERILPRTDTPGARDANVHRYIDRMLKDGMPAGEREAFLAGLAWLDARCTTRLGRAFVDLSEMQQIAVLTEISTEPFFRQMKDLTLRGYYTSREGLLRELEYKGNGAYPGYPGCTHAEHQK